MSERPDPRAARIASALALHFAQARRYKLLLVAGQLPIQVLMTLMGIALAFYPAAAGDEYAALVFATGLTMAPGFALGGLGSAFLVASTLSAPPPGRAATFTLWAWWSLALSMTAIAVGIGVSFLLIAESR